MAKTWSNRRSSRDIPNGQMKEDRTIKRIENDLPRCLNAAVWSASCSCAAAFHDVFNVRSFAAG